MHEEWIDGVFAVYGATSHQQVCDTEMLTELYRTIGHAIHTVETRSLRSDAVTNPQVCRKPQTRRCVASLGPTPA